MAKMKTVVTFVLDETGSMMSCKDDTIGGFNHYIKKLRESGETISFSLIKFDSIKIDKVCVDTPIAKVPELNEDTYQPGAATPLIDACVKAINATEAKVNGAKKTNVVVAIQTDGYENASREHTSQELQDLIKAKTEAGWVFVFLGADMDAFDQAQKFGISRATTMSYGKAETMSAFDTMSANTVAYAKTGRGSAMAFTDDQRTKSAGDAGSVLHPPAEPKKRAKKTKPIVDNFSL